MTSSISGGLNFYGFSAFFVPLYNEFGWSRAVLSGVFSLSRLEGGFLGPIEGFLADKFGPRRMMAVGLPMMGVGFLLLSRIDSLLDLYLVYILLITLGSSLGSFTPVGAAVANWFVKKRAMAFGVVMSGVAVGGAVFLPLLGWWITAFGWRSAAFSSGILMLVVAVPVSLVMRHRPEQYGYLPDGVEPGADDEIARAAAAEVVDASLPEAAPEMGPLESLKTSAFWFLGGSQALRAVVTTGFTIHFVAMMVDRGFSLGVGTGLLGSVMLLSLVGRIGLGWLGDRVDKRLLLVIGLLVMAVSMLGMSQAQTLALVLPLLLLYSVAYGGIIVVPFALQGDYFGRSAFATIRGMLNTVQTAGMLVGPVFAGFVYDTTGSYFIAFMGFAAAATLAAMLLLGLRRPVVKPEASARIPQA